MEVFTEFFSFLYKKDCVWRAFTFSALAKNGWDWTFRASISSGSSKQEQEHSEHSDGRSARSSAFMHEPWSHLSTWFYDAFCPKKKYPTFSLFGLLVVSSRPW